MNPHKTLIIKTGYSEVLDSGSNSRIVSFGDVLRTTPLLYLYKDDFTTWVTDEKALPLLEGNPLINRLLPLDMLTGFQLNSEEFDTVINLEKVPGVCALSDRIRARRARYGFTFNSQTGGAEAYDRAYEVLAVGADPGLKKANQKTLQELLFEMVGRSWNGEEYILGYSPNTSEKYDVALNTLVGSKWPNKAWSTKKWDSLEEKLIGKGFSVTRQDKQDKKVLENLYSYMNWLNSAKTIVTSDSLGLHIGIALKKHIFGLFGPTASSEVFFYNRGEAILPNSKYSCTPCFQPNCDNSTGKCIENISTEEVFEKITLWIK
jgi:heptosyltransferase-2